MGSLGNLWFELGLKGDAEEKLKELKTMVDDLLKKREIKIDVGSSLKTKIAETAKTTEEVVRSAKKATNEQEKMQNSLLDKVRKVNGEARKLAEIQYIKGNGGDLIKNMLVVVNGFKKTLKDAAQSGDIDKMSAAIDSYGAKWSRITNQIRVAKAEQDKLNNDTKSKRNRELEIAVQKAEALRKIETKISEIEFKKSNLGIVGTKVDEAINKLNEYKKKIESINSSTKPATAKSVLGGDLNRKVKEAERLVSLQDKINRGAIRTAEAQKKHEAEIRRSNEALAKQVGIVSELSSIMNNYLSLYSLKKFVTDVITIGGEFEKQHIALQTILGDIAKADTLYGQLKEFAVVSPFEFKDVVQQTKQLAAFGVEADNLMETTQRLGDIAAGLGVDFGRLALAYGETKARGWLDGKELRQFAYMGIPLLQKLSDHYTELAKEQGKAAVSTNDVRKMMRKGLVDFKTVDDILKEMTNAGGMFYNMQVTMSETVAGKWKNLGDAYDVMLSEIEGGNNTVLMGMIQFLMNIMKSWESWLPLVAGMTTAMASFGLATSGAQLATLKLGGALAVITAHPIVAIGAAAIGIASGLYLANQNANKLKNEFEELDNNSQNLFYGASMKLEVLKSRLSNVTEGSEEYKDMLNQLKKEYPSYFNNLDIEKAKYLDVARSIDVAITKIKEKAAADLYSQKISKANELFQNNQSSNVSNIANNIVGTRNGHALTASERREFANSLSSIISADSNSSLNAYQALNAAMEETGVKLGDQSKWRGWLLTVVNNMIDENKELNEALNGAYDSVKALYGDFNVIKQETNNLIVDMEDSTVPDFSNKERSSSKDVQLESWNTLRKHLEDYIEAYKKYKSILGDDLAKKRVFSMEGFKDLAEIGFNDPSDIKNIYSTLAEKLQSIGINSEARGQALNEVKAKIENVDFEIEKDTMAAAKKDLERKMKSVVSQWDLYIDWFSATGDSSLAARMSGVNNIAYKNVVEQMREGLSEALKKEKSLLSVDDVLGLDTEQLNSIFGEDNQIIKSITMLQEQYRKLSEESSKSLLDIVKNHQSYASQIKAIDDKLAKDIETVNSSNLTDSVKKSTIEGLNNDALEKKSELMFENFKKTTEWTKAFEDLDRVSTGTIKTLMTEMESFANNGNLSVKTVKELQNAMKKLREEAINRNPIAAMFGTIRDMNSWNYNKISGVYWKSGFDEDGNQTMITKSKSEMADIMKGYNDELAKESLALASKFKTVAEAADLLGGMFENLFGSSEFLQDLSGVLSGFAGGAQTGAGIASAFGLSGHWGAAAGAAIGLITSIAGLHDKALQKEIEASERRQKEMQNLSKNLEKALERAIGGIYGVNGSNGKSYYDTQKGLLVGQRAETYSQMQSEIKKKKSDDDAISDYKQKIKELDDQIAYFAKDMADSLYGIDFKSWAKDLSSALVDAWKNGEDAAEAWNNTVSDILSNLATSVLSQKYIESALAQVQKEFFDWFDAADGKLDDVGLGILSNMYDVVDQGKRFTDVLMSGLEKVANSHGVSLYSKKDNEEDTSELDSFISTVQSAFSDIEKSGEDVAKSIGEHFRNELVKSLISDNYKNEMQGLLNLYKQLINAKSADEKASLWNDLQNDISSLSEKIKTGIDDINSLTGYEVPQKLDEGLESFKNNLDSSFQSLDKSSEDLSESMLSHFRSAFTEKIISTKFEKKINEIYNLYKKYSDNPSVQAWEELEAEVTKFSETVEKEEEDVKRLTKVAANGISESLKNAFKELESAFTSTMSNINAKSEDMLKSLREKMWANVASGVYEKKYKNQMEALDKEYEEYFEGGDKYGENLPKEYWEKADEAMLEYYNDLQKLAEDSTYDLIKDVEEIKEEIKEEIEYAAPDTSEWDNFNNSVLESMKGLESSAKDVSNSISDYLREKLIEAVYAKNIEPEVHKWFGMYESAMSDGLLSEKEKNNLDKLRDEIAERAVAERKAVDDLLGTVKSGREGLSKGIEGITENTADILAAYINGIRADVSIIRSLLGGGDNESMTPIAQAQLQQLNMIAENTRRNADAADRISNIFNQVTNGTKFIYVK